MSDYTEMWSSLGLDLKSHDALLSFLGSAYSDIFLSQKNRPEGMQDFDFVMSEANMDSASRGLRDAKAQGQNVIGSYCVFVPEELTSAVDGVAVGLCAGAEFNFEGAETVLPRNTCSLIKAAFGFKSWGRCAPIWKRTTSWWERIPVMARKSYPAAPRPARQGPVYHGSPTNKKCDGQGFRRRRNTASLS